MAMAMDGTERMGIGGTFDTTPFNVLHMSHLTARWSRMRWMMNAGFVIALLFSLGGEYALGGNHVVATTKAYALFSHALPLGIRGHGIAMLILGVVLLTTMMRQEGGLPTWWPALRVTLWLCVGYFLWTAALFLFAPSQPGGTLSWPAVTLWVLLTIPPLILTFGPPPGVVASSEVELVQAAIESGLTQHEAAVLAQRFFGGGSEDV